MCLTSSIYAQTGINTSDVNPQAALHIEAPENNKGIIIPRLTEEQRDKISTSIAEDGLTIYNIDEDCINYWSKLENEWKSVCGKLGKSEFTFDCEEDVEVHGTYIEGKEMTSSNYLSIKVNVTKVGEYVLAAKTTNGYNFIATGTFLNTGLHTINVVSQGKPMNVSKDDLTFSVNSVEMVCPISKTIEVLKVAGSYDIACKSITVNGVYKVKVPLNASNTISVPIDVDKVGSWSIYSNSVDGISFKGEGTFTTVGRHDVILYGTGIPVSTIPKRLTLVHNSDGFENSTCSFNVRVVIPSKRILGIGSGTTYGYNITNRRPTRILLEEENNYGTLENSIVPFEGFSEFINGSNNPSETELRNWLLGSNPVDIVVIGFSYNMSETESQVFLDYLLRGGVLIAHTEGQSGNQRMLRTIFNDPTLEQKVTGGTGDGRTYKLPIFDDIILNGPFGDIRGKNWGDDATDAVYFTNLPTGDIIPYSNAMNANNNTGQVPNSVTAFRHRTFNFVWIGEGGFTSQSGNAGDLRSATICPFVLDSNNYPVVKTTYSTPVYNSVFFANTIAWAIDQAEHNGINTK